MNYIYEIQKTCPLCGKESMVVLFDEDTDKFDAYYESPNTTIQDIFPDTDPAIREFLRNDTSGYCRNCMEKMYGRTSDMILDGHSVLDELRLNPEDIESPEEYRTLHAEISELAEMCEERMEYLPKGHAVIPMTKKKFRMDMENRLTPALYTKNLVLAYSTDKEVSA